MTRKHLSYLPYLEKEAFLILDVVFNAFDHDKICVLFSGGKDSCVVYDLVKRYAKKHEVEVPYLLSIDTGYGFPEVNEFLHSTGAIVRSVEDSILRGTVPARPFGESRNADQAVTLKEAIAEFKPSAILCGARRDEDRARAKERVFSHRDRNGNWLPERQRLEVNGVITDLRLYEDEHFRVFPLSNWLESDVWEYISKHDVAIPSIYYAHERSGYEGSVRFRTVGDRLTTKPVASSAKTADEVLLEVLSAELSERGATRLDDAAVSMEDRKRQGYF